jgi:hypothetical protein
MRSGFFTRSIYFNEKIGLQNSVKAMTDKIRHSEYHDNFKPGTWNLEP